jgi:hypothetical protein
MPAWSLYDFGDLVRFTARRAPETRYDLALAGTDQRVYQALVDAISERAAFLAPDELELMPFAGRLVTFMLGVRFLTTISQGRLLQDFPPRHNLDARACSSRWSTAWSRCMV